MFRNHRDHDFWVFDGSKADKNRMFLPLAADCFKTLAAVFFQSDDLDGSSFSSQGPARNSGASSGAERVGDHLPKDSAHDFEVLWLNVLGLMDDLGLDFKQSFAIVVGVMFDQVGAPDSSISAKEISINEECDAKK